MLLCYGGVGNGKTHLCEATAIVLYKRGIYCAVLSMAKIMRALKVAINNDKHSWGGGLPWTPYDELLDRYCRCGHMIIDDVGMGGSGSEWEFWQLEEIIVARYREKLFTILTSNLDIKQDKKNPNIPFIPERIASRFQDRNVGRVVLNSGEDYRPEKGKI